MREDGKKPDIIDGVVGTPARTATLELTEAQSRAFSPWNLLRWNAAGVDDGWDPAGVRAKYELPWRAAHAHRMTNGAPHIHTTEAGAEISAQALPAQSSAASHWVTDSKLVKLSAATGGKIRRHQGQQHRQTQVVAIHATADNGFYATAYLPWTRPISPYRSWPGSRSCAQRVTRFSCLTTCRWRPGREGPVSGQLVRLPGQGLRGRSLRRGRLPR